MSDNARVTLLFLANFLLYFIIGELNNFVSRFSIYLHLDALLLVFFGLFLPRKTGLLFVVILGFLSDAIHPVPTGTFFIGHLLMWLFFVWCQRRIRRQNPLHIKLVAIIAQSLWVLALAILLGQYQYGEWVYWQRILSDLAISCAVIYLVTWMWCVFQKNLLYSLGWDLEAQVSRM